MSRLLYVGPGDDSDCICYYELSNAELGAEVQLVLHTKHVECPVHSGNGKPKEAWMLVIKPQRRLNGMVVVARCTCDPGFSSLPMIGEYAVQQAMDSARRHLEQHHQVT